MPYCRECGTKLSDNEKAGFCPNCGAQVETVLETVRDVQVSGTTKKETRRRIETMIAAVIVCLIITFLGAALPMRPGEAQIVSQEFEELERVMSSFGMATIFGNNLMHAFAMFTPFIGPLYGSYVLFSTGRVVAALAVTRGGSAVSLFVYTIIFPHAWVEYTSYGLALSESFWLAVAIFRHRFRSELPNLFKAIAVCALLLLSAAAIETSLISLLT